MGMLHLGKFPRLFEIRLDQALTVQQMHRKWWNFSFRRWLNAELQSQSGQLRDLLVSWAPSSESDVPRWVWTFWVNLQWNVCINIFLTGGRQIFSYPGQVAEANGRRHIFEINGWRHGARGDENSASSYAGSSWGSKSISWRGRCSVKPGDISLSKSCFLQFAPKIRLYGSWLYVSVSLMFLVCKLLESFEPCSPSCYIVEYGGGCQRFEQKRED